jgi:DNA-binding transcriptional ArsR family regulator
VLREAGVVTSERRGQWIYYRLAPDVAVRLATIARGMIPGGLIPASDLVARRRHADASAEAPGAVSASA